MLGPGYTAGTVTDKISSIVLGQRRRRGWFFGFAISFALLMMLLYAVTWLLVVGVGIWGVNIPIGWGFAIVNFVWWIGIGHAGTLISAILLLLRQKWRTSINRFAEAMTLVCCVLRGIVSAAAHGTAVAGLLAISVSEYDGNLAAISQPAGLGCVCGVDVRDGVAAVLVRGIDTGSGDVAGSGAEPGEASDLRNIRDGMERIGGALASL